MSAMTYQDLVHGETLELGDEFLRDGQWVPLDEDGFAQWSAFSHAYHEDKMPRFRRPTSKPKALVLRTQYLLNQAMYSAEKRAHAELTGVHVAAPRGKKGGKQHPYSKGRVAPMPLLAKAKQRAPDMVDVPEVSTTPPAAAPTKQPDAVRPSLWGRVRKIFR